MTPLYIWLGAVMISVTIWLCVRFGVEPYLKRIARALEKANGIPYPAGE